MSATGNVGGRLARQHSVQAFDTGNLMIPQGSVSFFEGRRLVSAFAGLSVIALIVSWLLNIHAFGEILVFRHDELYYEPDYTHKLESEGRWINFLLSDYLAMIPGFVCFLAAQAAFFFFCARAAYHSSRDAWLSVAIGLVAVQVPFLTDQLLWPATSLPAFLVLFAAALLAYRLPHAVFFPLFSVLFFGTLSHYYFLLPLLFLSGMTFREFRNILLIWVAAFVFGYGVTQLATYFLANQFIEIAEWRAANPVQTWGDLVANLQRAYTALADVNQELYGFLGPAGLAGACLLLISGLQRRLDALLPVAVLILSGLAVFASGVPLGLGVHSRTALTYAVALVFLFCVRENASNPVRAGLLAGCLVLGSKLALVNHTSIEWYAGVTNKLRGEIAATIPDDLSTDTKVVLGISSPDWARIITRIEACEGLTYVTGEGVASGYRVSTILKDLGYRNVAWCIEAHCDQLSARTVRGPENCGSSIFIPYRHDRSTFGLFASEQYTH